MQTVIMEPRGYAAAFLLVMVLGVLGLSRWMAARSRRPAIAWATGGYLAFLHLISLIGILVSAQFEGGLAQLTLFTFPCSFAVFDGRAVAGFGSVHDLAINYIRYIVLFGGFDAALLAGFLALALKPRRTAAFVA